MRVAYWYGQFGVVCHHHHKTVFGDLFEQIHDLHGSVGIKRTGWLVGEHDIRIVHQRACNGHALHLTAGKLVRLFVDVFAQTHLFKRLARTFSTLRTRYARNGQGKFHIRQNGLMGNENCSSGIRNRWCGCDRSPNRGFCIVWWKCR